jgi:hypothetical protein
MLAVIVEAAIGTARGLQKVDMRNNSTTKEKQS